MPRFIKRSQKPNALDGFIVSGPRRPIGSRGADGLNSQLIRPQGNRLDDFKKPEGFRGRISPKLTMTGEYSKPADVAGLQFELASNNGQPTKVKHMKKPRKGLKIVLRMFLILIVAVLLTSGYLFGKAWWNAHKVFKGGGSALAFDENLDPALLNGEGDGRVNILLLGKGGGDHVGGELTDSIMIASLDPINKGIVLLSVPRDLWVSPDGLWSMKINEVYTRAKDKAALKTPDDESAIEAAGLNKICEVIEQYLGIHMNFYTMIEFSAFEETVNTLGGVTITLPEEYYDGTMLVGNRYLYLPVGTQDLDGGMALAYARSRMGSSRGDFDRGEHQQTVLVAIKDKVMTIGTFANPIKISQLLDTFGERVRTNLSIDDMLRVYNFMKDLPSENITHTDLAQEDEAVVRTGNVNGLSVVYPIAGVDNYDDVKTFVRTKLKDGFITKENPSIIVLNGTTESGLAQQQADILTGYGYNVIQVADAPISVTATQVIDKTNGQKPYTIRYMELRYNTESVTNLEGLALSTYQADFIIVVGP